MGDGLHVRGAKTTYIGVDSECQVRVVGSVSLVGRLNTLSWAVYSGDSTLSAHHRGRGTPVADSHILDESRLTVIYYFCIWGPYQAKSSHWPPPSTLSSQLGLRAGPLDSLKPQPNCYIQGKLLQELIRSILQRGKQLVMCKNDLTASSWCYSTLSSGQRLTSVAFLWGTRGEI